MQLKTRRPFQDLDDFFGRYARLFKSGFPGDGETSDDGAWSPSADISESKKEYTIKAELPDVDKSDIHVSVQDGALMIEGERKHQEEEEDETYHRVESFYGKFSRTFALPENVDETKIKADCKKGVLRVRLPKTKESEPKGAREISVS